MKDIDLNRIWDSDQEKARHHFQSLPDPIALAKKKSNTILHRIRRNMLLESIAGVVIVAFLAFNFYSWGPLVFYGFILFTGIVAIFSFYIYWKLHNDLKNVDQQRVTDALKEYIRLTGNYIRRLKIIVHWITPTGFLLGMLLASIPDMGDISVRTFLIAIAIGAAMGSPLVIFLIWFINRHYIKWVYGKHYHALKQTLEGLESENGPEKPV